MDWNFTSDTEAHCAHYTIRRTPLGWDLYIGDTVIERGIESVDAATASARAKDEALERMVNEIVNVMPPRLDIERRIALRIDAINAVGKSARTALVDIRRKSEFTHVRALMMLERILTAVGVASANSVRSSGEDILFNMLVINFEHVIDIQRFACLFSCAIYSGHCVEDALDMATAQTVTELRARLEEQQEGSDDGLCG